MKKLLVPSLCLASLSSFAAFDTPEAAVAALAAAEAAGKAPALAEFLPATYQKDLTDVIQLFGNKMDPAVWAGATDLLATAGKTLAPKAEFLVGDDVAEADRPDRAKSVSNVLTSLSTLMASDTVKLDNLKTTSSVGLYDAIVSVIMPLAGQTPADPENFKVVKSEKLESGDVRLTFANDALVKTFDGDLAAKTIDFRSVEGCWIPSDMADGWTESMNSAKEALNGLNFTSTEGQQMKSQLLMALPSLKMGIQQLGAATSKEDLQQKGAMLLMPLMMLGGGNIGL